MLMASEEASMRVTLTEDEREQLTAAAARERRVRHWRRYQALLLLAEDKPPEAVATAVGCSRASVYNWVKAWQTAGIAGLIESPHVAAPRAHTAPLAALLTALLGSDPQQYGHHSAQRAPAGWTVPLLHGETRRAGYLVSTRTVRRTVRRLGWRWKRPKYVLGRPDPADAEKRGADRPHRGDAGGGRDGLVR
jgi:transposase